MPQAPTLTAAAVRHELALLADPHKATVLTRFFQCAPGGYGEGDRFIGVQVPPQRKLARTFRALPPEAISELLQDGIHEHRFTGFLILVGRFASGDTATRAHSFALCRTHLAGLNNWDLVDTVAPGLLGPHLLDNPTLKPWLDTLARSPVLWERRIAIISTLAFIRADAFEDTLRLAERLLHDKHDLMHKAVGWMLREVGNRDLKQEEAFLDRHAHEMPRTMLRYAIEKFPADRRQHFMRQKG
ncbi:DNA alkylation repair protein [Myxococcaceae bacterium JPH2]|nr:DNA alkylation repair protein [Myxococcaceae bacterium JPH2]